jgi:hypothetical protein
MKWVLYTYLFQTISGRRDNMLIMLKLAFEFKVTTLKFYNLFNKYGILFILKISFRGVVTLYRTL